MSLDVQPQGSVNGRQEPVSRGTKECFSLTTRNPSIVKLEFSLDSDLDQAHGPGPFGVLRVFLQT